MKHFLLRKHATLCFCGFLSLLSLNIAAVEKLPPADSRAVDSRAVAASAAGTSALDPAGSSGKGAATNHQPDQDQGQDQDQDQNTAEAEEEEAQETASSAPAGRQSAKEPVYNIADIKPAIRETDMMRALSQGDLEAFKAAVKKGFFEEPAIKFLNDWNSLSEKGETVIHLLAGMSFQTAEEEEEAARFLFELTQLFSFPEGNRSRQKAFWFQNNRIVQPLERSPLYQPAFQGRFDIFIQEMHYLLDKPAEEPAAALHGVTRSKMTLEGFINKFLKDDRKALKRQKKEAAAPAPERASAGEEAAARLQEISPHLKQRIHLAKTTGLLLESIRWRFKNPFQSESGGGVSPAATAREAGNESIYYVLRNFAGDGKREDLVGISIISGGTALFGVEVALLWAAENNIGGAAPARFAEIAGSLPIEAGVFAPVLLTVAGIACYRAFKSKKQSQTLRLLHTDKTQP